MSETTVLQLSAQLSRYEKELNDILPHLSKRLTKVTILITSEEINHSAATVVVFGLPIEVPASFKKWLTERAEELAGLKLQAEHSLNQKLAE